MHKSLISEVFDLRALRLAIPVGTLEWNAMHLINGKCSFSPVLANLDIEYCYDSFLEQCNENVVFNPDVKKAVLVEPEIVLRNGAMIEVSGWGFSNLPQAYVNQLLWTDMVVIDKAECAKYYKQLLTPSNFCAKYLPDHRLSDNGGPAVFDREVVVGMLSYGGTSADEPHIAIFSNISYFSRWITLNTKRFLEKYCVVPKDDDPPEYYVLSETDD